MATFNTKFKKRDFVYVIIGDEIHWMMIDGVQITDSTHLWGNPPSIRYSLDDGKPRYGDDFMHHSPDFRYKEEELFATKEEAEKALANRNKNKKIS